MSFGYNVNTNAGQSQFEDNHSERHSRRTPGSALGPSGIDRRTMPDLSERQSGSSQPLRLPSIQLPSHVDFSRNYPPTRFSTCPSLHQHHSGKDATPTSETMLRKFFARSDDISVSPFHPAAPAENRWPDGVLTPRNQAAPQTPGGHFRRISHSQQTYPSNGGHPEENEQTIFMAGGASKTYSSHVGSSTRADEPRQVEERSWQDQLQNGSSTSHKSGFAESSSSSTVYEEGEIDQGELYRCRDCNRKCKSQASYLKHRSMMCTHRLGALTLECRYCKRNYTYAGYLQRHELECAKNKPM